MQHRSAELQQTLQQKEAELQQLRMELQRAQQQQQAPVAGQVQQELLEMQRAPDVSLDPVDDVSWATVVKCGMLQTVWRHIV